ncbi:hypothetical protein PQX77_015827 [Marasmius sp. AFHP31]|nr:hypothetical protein PQX77_015827 [Marasmius sp. AFHP31]
MASSPPPKRLKIEEAKSKWLSSEDIEELSKDAANWNLDRSYWEKADQRYQDLYKPENGVDSTTLEFEFPSGVQTKLYFVRKCFDALYKLVHERAYYGKTSLIIGQSGTGKRVALHYLVLRTLTESPKRPIFFITTMTVYLFWQGEVLQRPIYDFRDGAVPRSHLQDLRLLVFTDLESSKSTANIPSMFRESPCVIIQASAPNPANYRWTKYRHPVEIGLPSWTWEEFKLGLRYELPMRFKDLLHDIHTYASDPSKTTSAHVVSAYNIIQKAITEASSSKATDGREKLNITLVPDGPDEELNEDDVDTQATSSTPLDLYYSPEGIKEVRDIRKLLISTTNIRDMDEAFMGDVLLAEALAICGPNMRDILQVIPNQRRPAEIDPFVVQFNYRELRAIFLGLRGALNFTPGLLDSSHNVIVITPLPEPTLTTTDVVPFPRWKPTFRSAAIYRTFVGHIQVSERTDQEHMCGVLQVHRVPDSAGPLFNALFECMAPRIISCTGPTSLVRMYKNPHTTAYYKTPKTPVPHAFTLPRAPVYYCSFEQGKLGDILSVGSLSPHPTAASSPSGDRYIFSAGSNAPLFNGILVQPSTQNVTLWILQVTTQLSAYQGSSKAYSFINEMVAGMQKIYGLKVTLRYVLVKPLRYGERVSGEWEMPVGWESYKGHVFCAHLRVPT